LAEHIKEEPHTMGNMIMTDVMEKESAHPSKQGAVNRSSCTPKE
jgi:hypothetical protein